MLAFRTFLTIAVSTASYKRNFSEIKLRNYFKWIAIKTIIISIILIKYNIVKDINYDDVI